MTGNAAVARLDGGSAAMPRLSFTPVDNQLVVSRPVSTRLPPIDAVRFSAEA